MSKNVRNITYFVQNHIKTSISRGFYEKKFRTVLPKNQYFGTFFCKKELLRDFNAENAMFTAVLNFFKHFLSKFSLFSAAKLFENN